MEKPKATIDQDDLLSSRDVCAILRIGRSKLDLIRKSGAFPKGTTRTVRGGTQNVWSRSEVEAVKADMVAKNIAAAKERHSSAKIVGLEAEGLITMPEATKMLGLSRNTFLRRIREGKVPARAAVRVYAGTRVHVWERAAIEALVGQKLKSNTGRRPKAR